ncbi:EF-hand domain-containing protein [Rhodanobacter sp. IGA1.0]|uniref:EF-hand domain-containing protein n=1 Tax=Rhodanobacter sp. IGA1.0 TaxID=3158582 RepID=A0AAU7QP59_9GAMM
MSLGKLPGTVATALVLCAASAASSAAPAAATGGVATAPLPPPATTAASIFHAVDANKDGALSPQEFAAGYAAVQRLMTLEIRLREQFGRVDADHGGSIDAGEYARLMLVRRAGAAAPPLAAFDADGNGSLNFAEYVVAIRRLAALRPAPAPAGK